MTIQAKARTLAHSPRKLAEVVDLVRRRSLADALVILEHTPRSAAQPVMKLLKSAQANARHNHNLQTDNLQIEEIYVTCAQRLKRGRAAARGRYQPYKLRRAHLHLSLSGQERATPKAEAKIKGSQ